jgi:hypothetical protein
LTAGENGLPVSSVFIAFHHARSAPTDIEHVLIDIGHGYIRATVTQRRRYRRCRPLIEDRSYAFSPV